ncbi:hypothetical protein Tco_1576460 [Tanacetum coccineum]
MENLRHTKVKGMYISGLSGGWEGLIDGVVSVIESLVSVVEVQLDWNKVFPDLRTGSGTVGFSSLPQLGSEGIWRIEAASTKQWIRKMNAGIENQPHPGAVLLTGRRPTSHGELGKFLHPGPGVGGDA